MARKEDHEIHYKQVVFHFHVSSRESSQKTVVRLLKKSNDSPHDDHRSTRQKRFDSRFTGARKQKGPCNRWTGAGAAGAARGSIPNREFWNHGSLQVLAKLRGKRVMRCVHVVLLRSSWVGGLCGEVVIVVQVANNLLGVVYHSFAN